MNTDSWIPYYKLDPQYRNRVGSNMLYTPLINPEGNILCQHWDEHSDYQQANTRVDFTTELIEYFFNREITGIGQFKEYIWAPKIYDIDTKQRKIFMEWNNITCNDLVYTDINLYDFCYDWDQQLELIIQNIIDAKFYKVSLYPHCFFFDQDKILKTFDFYACISHTERYIELTRLKGIMGGDKPYRFTEAIVDDKIDFDIFFKRSLRDHVVWPNHMLNKIYYKIYGI